MQEKIKNNLVMALKELREATKASVDKYDKNSLLLHDNLDRVSAEVEYILERFLVEVEEWR